MELDKFDEDVYKTFKLKMLKIVEKDNENNINKMPATNKLLNLNLFIDTLLNLKIQEILLDLNILEVVRRWLEPLPDNSLPNNKIKKGLLEVLKILNVEKSHLTESGIGKIVHFYMISPEETKEIKNLAKEVVHKWINKVIKDED